VWGGGGEGKREEVENFVKSTEGGLTPCDETAEKGGGSKLGREEKKSILSRR